MRVSQRRLEPQAAGEPSIEKSLQRPQISPARQGPRDITGNVQLYLTDAERTPFRMCAPLGGFGLGVKGEADPVVSQFEI